MAEIYTYSANASQGHMSPDTSDHINSVLADLGLGGTSADSADASRVGAEPVGTTAQEAPTAAGHSAAPATDGSPDPSHAILAASSPEPLPDAAPSHTPAPEPVAVAASAPPEGSAAAPTHMAAPAGADSLPGAHATYGSDAFGGLGTDTLWGSDGGGAHNLATLPPTPAGSDTIRSSGGMETIYGGNATIYASGHSTTIGTDTVHAGSEGATMDGSASAQALHTDGSHAFADLPGGSGSDTIVLHDTSGGVLPTHDDAQAASAYSGYDGAGGHDAGYYDTFSHDSVVGSDGSDHFALLGYPDGYDAGTADDGTGAHHDPYLSDGHVTHSDHGTYVSYHDGYDAGYSDPDQLQFKDTVMAG